MPRKHKNARQREIPRKTRIKVSEIKVQIYPKRQKFDIYPGRVAAVAEYVRGWQA